MTGNVLSQWHAIIFYLKRRKTKRWENGRKRQQRIKKKKRTKRIGAYNVMLCRKFIFNRLCTRTDTIIIININII